MPTSNDLRLTDADVQELERRVPGIRVLRDFITQAEEHSLLASINAQEWNTDIKRRTQQYGAKYDYRFFRYSLNFLLPLYLPSFLPYPLILPPSPLLFKLFICLLDHRSQVTKQSRSKRSPPFQILYHSSQSDYSSKISTQTSTHLTNSL